MCFAQTLQNFALGLITRMESFSFDGIFFESWIRLKGRQWHPTPVLLPGKSHGWRSLVGCSPWGCKESDMTEWLPFHFSLSSIGEGNGNPLQCSCLENPRDGGAWSAAIYGVTQSRTQLKRLSSSSRTELNWKATRGSELCLWNAKCSETKWKETLNLPTVTINHQLPL